MSCTSREAWVSHWRLILEVYMRSLICSEGETLRYLKSENVAETGSECCIPFRQSLMRFFCRKTSCCAVSEFWKRPE